MLADMPSNPRLISFDRSCFAVDGEDVRFVVFTALGIVDGTRNGASAREYTDRVAAEVRATKIGGSVSERRTPRRVRIRWTLAA